jgi:hypothetical protein
MLRVLSWGAGLASTTVGVMSVLGDLPRLNLILFCDLGWERRATYEVVEFYTDWFRRCGIETKVLKTGDIRRQGAEEHIHIPFYTENGAPLNRQCTWHFKIRPARRCIREVLGYHPTKAPHPPAGAVEQWFGYTVEEHDRRAWSRVAYIHNRYPLIERGMARADCERYLEERGLPVPPKSACVCCPFRAASEWLEMRRDYPAEWEEACWFDEANRHNPLAARGHSTADRLYLWRECVPLREADLEAAARRERTHVKVPLFVPEMAAQEGG